MPIKALPRYLLKSGEIAAFGSRLKTILTDAPAGDEHLGLLTGLLAQHTTDIVSAYGSIRENMFTPKLAQADSACDETINRFTRVVHGMCDDYDPAKAEAASIIYAILKKHEFGRTNASYAVQTTTTKAMLMDLDSPDAKAATVKAGVQPAVEEIRRNHLSFETIYQEKIANKAEVREPSISSLMAPLRLDIGEILDHLNSRERVLPAQYATFNKRVNELVIEMSAKAHARQNRKAAPENAAPVNK
jgi:hypothetical protein